LISAQAEQLTMLPIRAANSLKASLATNTSTLASPAADEWVHSDSSR
jgi:hypothetical protein